MEISSPTSPGWMPLTRPRQSRSLAFRRNHALLVGLTTAILFTLGFLYYIGLFTSNFRAVRDDRLYRSAQMHTNDLEVAFKRYGIKSVLNLRGESRKGAWFKNEREACRVAGVDFESIELDNSDLPRPDELNRLIERFEQGPYPMLIHCRRGADRTGLASVLYLVIVEKHSLENAMRTQYTWHQGRITLSPDANDRFLTLYSDTHAGQSMRDWIIKSYPALFKKLESKG